ncbi:MAG: ATP-dependent Clp protease adaptor ClpS [Polyangiales bacterium]
MSDRDGVLLEAPSRAGSYAIGATLLAAPIAVLCGLPAELTVVVTAVLAVLQTRPTKLLFRADALHERWFFLRTRIAYVELVGFSLDEHGLLLSLRNGSKHRIHAPVAYGPHGGAIRDAIAHMLAQTAGIHPEGGPILRVGDQDVTPFVLAEPSSALEASMQVAKRMASERGSHAVESADFVEALVVGPERAVLATFGLDVEAIDVEPSGDAYRGELVDELSPSFGATLRAARLASGHRKQELGPIDLLLELIRTGDAAAELLVARGLVPIRIVDHRAHGLSPAESDARSKKTLTSDALLAGIDTDRVAVVFVNDAYTPFVVVARLLEKYLDFGPAEANAFARRVDAEGRVAHGNYPRNEGAKLAIDLMHEARRVGSPLLIELAADRMARK